MIRGGGPRATRTPNLLFRRQMLYPIELWPARGSFVKFLKDEQIGSNGYRGGWNISYYSMMNGQEYSHTQSMDIKEVGCEAFALVLKKYGMTAYMESRAD